MVGCLFNPLLLMRHGINSTTNKTVIKTLPWDIFYDRPVSREKRTLCLESIPLHGSRWKEKIKCRTFWKLLQQPMNLFHFHPSWGDQTITLSTSESAPWLCVYVCLSARLVWCCEGQPDFSAFCWGPLLRKHRPQGIGQRGPRCRRCRGWNMIWIIPLKWEISH